jgi:hypothetical protein
LSIIKIYFVLSGATRWLSKTFNPAPGIRKIDRAAGMAGAPASTGAKGRAKAVAARVAAPPPCPTRLICA